MIFINVIRLNEKNELRILENKKVGSKSGSVKKEQGSANMLPQSKYVLRGKGCTHAFFATFSNATTPQGRLLRGPLLHLPPNSCKHLQKSHYGPHNQYNPNVARPPHHITLYQQ